MITSIICIVFGVMFCIWPGTILVTLCRIAGFVLFSGRYCTADPGNPYSGNAGTFRAVTSGRGLRSYRYLDFGKTGRFCITDPEF